MKLCLRRVGTLETICQQGISGARICNIPNKNIAHVKSLAFLDALSQIKVLVTGRTALDCKKPRLQRETSL